MNNLDINFEKDQYNSFLDNSNVGNKDEENLFTDTIQNISEISKIQSGFLQGLEDENWKSRLLLLLDIFILKVKLVNIRL